MQKKSERGKRTTIVGALLAAAIVMGLGAGQAEAQSRRYRPVPNRNLQAEAQLAAKITQLNQLVAQERARQAAFWAAVPRRTYAPGQIPTTIPVGMPMYGPLTPGQRIAQQTLTGAIIGSARAGCEARRASQPVNPYRPGSVNDGFYNTMIGPRVGSC